METVDLRWDAVVIDCRDPHELARFWCALLGTRVRHDLHVPSVDHLPAAVERAETLGATVVSRHGNKVGTWVTLADPEGSVFCVVAD